MIERSGEILIGYAVLLRGIHEQLLQKCHQRNFWRSNLYMKLDERQERLLPGRLNLALTTDSLATVRNAPARNHYRLPEAKDASKVRVQSFEWSNDPWARTSSF